MDKHALLLRLNPKYWPVWKEKIVPNEDVNIWFKTGRRRAEEIYPDTPVIVLGTNRRGVVAFGKTVTVECRSDPDWEEVALKFQEECKKHENRVCVKIRRVFLSLEEIKKYRVIADLYKRRETTTWLSMKQFNVLMSLIEEIDQFGGVSIL